jgi:hypothetical protein
MLEHYTFFALRPLLIAWAGLNFPKLEWSSLAAKSIAGYDLDEAALETDDSESPVDYAVLAAVNAVQTLMIIGPPTEVLAIDAIGMADGAVEEAGKADFSLKLTPADVWSQARIDQKWLEKNSDKRPIARIFSRYGLWLGPPPQEIQDLWRTLSSRLSFIDPNYSVWIDWYERRIRGERAAFDIPGDKRRVEDKKILRRLAEASDEDFWGKGHEYVNATLKSWLDEARERVRPEQVHNLQATNASTGPPEAGTATLGIVQNSIDTIALPPQEPTAITYGLNAEGKLDRLPHSDQAKLHDTVDQRRAYDDLKAAALALHEEGQRLGPRLLKAVERFVASLPESFEDAETYPVWRDANALRRLNRAHIQAAKSAEPDEAKLEPVIAETLGGVLDLYNHFAFADDGLRAKDEQRISPQERADAEAEAAAAKPVIEAILSAPNIATQAALDDLVAEKDQSSLPTDDPYAAQAQTQANIMVRNQSSGLLGEVGNAIKDKRFMGGAIAGSIVGGATWDGIKYAGSTALASASGVDLTVIIEFIATFAIILQHYVAIAFPTFEHLPDLIERIRLFWQTQKSEK